MLPPLYFDHDVSVVVARSMRLRGIALTIAVELGLGDALDSVQLFTAAQRDELLVTHDKTHYEVLHDAWFRWSAAWGVGQRHAGIIVLPHGPTTYVEDMLMGVLNDHTVFADLLFRWQPARGWLIDGKP